ncbi:DnaT-like ssDNA-binding protein [Pseudooceanicola sp. C21-150M6]|uniref:DnaT-like ssDNA-binding protein n=1 Tax=Pseudooceanicola sp. C21-150M6 TaxID=3434355 RepID=UPI003D7F6B71
MAVTVEDGSNVAGSNAYTNEAAYIAWASLTFDETVTTSDALSAAIVRACQRLDSLPWKGWRTYGRAQAMAFPRSEMTDGEGNEISEDEIPAEVIEAQHYMTRAELASPGSLSPSITRQGQKVLNKVGDLGWEVTGAPNTIDSYRPVMTAVDDLLAGLLIGGGATTLLLRG